MSRTRYLVAYDIRDPLRLRKVLKAVKGYGYALQYSVFICDLDRIEKVELRSALGEVIAHETDSVVFIELGDPGARGQECIEFLGDRRALPKSGWNVV